MSMILKSGTSTNWGTPGDYILDGVKYLKTLEPIKPVIPVGNYLLQMYFSLKHGYYVPRFVSLIDASFADRCLESHIGNVYLDTEGCVLVGEGYDDIDCSAVYRPSDPRNALGIIPGIINSKVAFKHMMNDPKMDFGKTHLDSKGNEYYTGGMPIEVIR